MLPTLRSSFLKVRAAVTAECYVDFQQKMEGTRLMVANILSAVNQFSDKDTSHVSVSKPPPNVELKPVERAEIEWRGGLSLLKAKGLDCINLDWRHSVRSI